jgi:hypothetical protein
MLVVLRVKEIPSDSSEGIIFLAQHQLMKNDTAAKIVVVLPIKLCW